MRLLPLLCIPLAIVASSAASNAPAEQRSRLAEILTPQEFRNSGLTKLTPDELAHLAEALAQHGALPTRSNDAKAIEPALKPPSAGASRNDSQRTARHDEGFGAEQITRPTETSAPDELHSRIEGTLEEFSGRAAFVLENGQVWQQRIPDSVHFSHKLINPEVIITHGLGGYKMLIVPANRVVFVKRLQ